MLNFEYHIIIEKLSTKQCRDIRTEMDNMCKFYMYNRIEDESHTIMMHDGKQWNNAPLIHEVHDYEFFFKDKETATEMKLRFG